MRTKDKMLKRIRKGQEEMVGFVLIIVLVMIIILVFVAFSLRKGSSKAVESFEVDSFIQAIKQFTTDCAIGTETKYRSIDQLASNCQTGDKCYDGRDSCDVLEADLRALLNKGWSSQDRGAIKGYYLIIKTDNKIIVNITEGNTTRKYKGPTSGLDDELGIDLRI